MDVTILRGFCQICELDVKLINEKEKWNPLHKKESHHPIPVWFLSPNQMKIIYMSEGWNILNDKIRIKTGVPSPKDLHVLTWALANEPFLVAQLLKENLE